MIKRQLTDASTTPSAPKLHKITTSLEKPVVTFMALSKVQNSPIASEWHLNS